MIRRISSVVGAALLLPVAAIPPAQVLAAEAVPASSPVCMIGPRQGQETRSRPPLIMLSQADVATMQGLGWQTVACNGKEQGLTQYRTSMCNFANTAPPPVQQRFKASNGASPAELCAMAGRAVP